MNNWWKAVLTVTLAGTLMACDSNTVMMDKVLDEDSASVKAMLDGGAEVNARNDYGWTALTHAARMGHTELAALLLDSGAEVDAVDDTGWTPLMRAVMKGHQQTAQLLLNRGANIKHRDKNGWTVLHWAAQQDNAEQMKALIDAGSDLFGQTDDGWTPRMVAQNDGHVELVNLINRWMKKAEAERESK